jgi:hypothetical protein
MSLAQALSDAVAFQVKFANRIDTELTSRREQLWATVEEQIERLIADRLRAKTLNLKRK